MALTVMQAPAVRLQVIPVVTVTGVATAGTAVTVVPGVS